MESLIKIYSLIEFVILSQSQIDFCRSEMFRLQNYLFKFCSCVVNSQSLFFSKRTVKEMFIVKLSRTYVGD